MKKIFASLLILVFTFCLFAQGISETSTSDTTKPISTDTVDLSKLKISSPSGAPALALATLAAQNPEQYTFVAAETIAAEFANKNSDFIIAPVNAGARLFTLGKSNYKLAVVVSWGNLFIASQRPNFSLSDINDSEIILFGENTINASVVLYCLTQNGIRPSQISYLASAANTQQLLLTDPNAIVVTAEPALTAARSKNSSITAYSVNELYSQANATQTSTTQVGFTQAGLFVRPDLDSMVVDAYLAQVQDSCTKCTTDLDAVAQAAVELEILPNVNIAKSAIPNCAVRYVSALEAKEQIESTAKIDLTQFGGSLPTDDFYYGAN